MREILFAARLWRRGLCWFCRFRIGGKSEFFSEPTPLEWSEDDWRYAFEERAAIYEFDGGYDRAEAERLARIEITAMKRRTIH